MLKTTNRKMMAVVSDLFFTVKINDAAKKAAMQPEFLLEPNQVMARAAEEKPALIIFDLNFDAANPLHLIQQLKGDADLKGINLIGYLSHIQADLKQKAQEAGCDMVMAKSAFSQNIQQILKRYSGVV
jgi:PleD family two-component response regulator